MVPALLRARPADVDRLAELTGRRARTCAPSSTRRRGHDAVAAGGRGAPRRRRRGHRGRDRRRVRGPRAAPGLPAGRAARAGARLRGGGHARGRGALAGPAAGRDRRPRRARAAVRRGAARDQRAAVPVRRPAGHAGRARRAAGPRAAVPTCGSRSTWGCSAGSTPASPRPCARSPGRGARSAPPWRWTRRSGQILAIASTPSFDNNIYGPPVDGAALQALADGAGVADARARDPGGRAARVDVQARRGRGEPGPSGLRAAPGHPHRGRASPTAATPSATGGRWGRWTWWSRSPSPTTSTSTSSPSRSAPTR